MHAVAVPNLHSREMDFPVNLDAVLNSLHDAIPWLQHQGVGREV